MWTFEPHISMGLWWALVALSCAALAYYWVRSEWALSPTKRALVTVLLGISVVGPLLIALNPIWLETLPPLPGKPLLSVLLDGTMSMQTADAVPGSSQTRWDAGYKAANRTGESTSSLDIRKYAFDASLQKLPSQETELSTWPRGHRSDLSSAIREALRSETSGGHAVVLISDGAHNSGSIDGLLAVAQEARSMDTPIYTVTLGSDIESRNLFVSVRTPRMIVFPNNPLTIRVRVGHSGLEGESTPLALMLGDSIVQTKNILFSQAPYQEVQFQLDRIPNDRLTRYRVVAGAVQGEASEADNQSTVLVQRMDAPIGILLLEGKPYWDSKFLARNLAADPAVELSTMIRLGDSRYLRKKYPRANPSENNSTTDAKPAVDASAAMEASATTDWVIQKEMDSPLDSIEALDAYRVVVLGRDADTFLTDKSIENLREWVSRRGGCLLCSRGAPSNQIAKKLAEILPVRWAASNEARFRAKVSQYGFDSAMFDPLLQDGVDPLMMMPSLSSGAIPKARAGLPQVLLQSVLDGSGNAIPVVVYQPYGSGQSIVVEGSGMWRWAFLPPNHAEKDKIYPTLWQSMIQWIVSQQDLMPGQKLAIRSDKATFLTGDHASATILLKDQAGFLDANGAPDFSVMLQGGDMKLPKRFVPIAVGTEKDLYRVDFGAIEVGYYTATVVQGEREEALSEASLEIRDPWFERLEVDARPDLMRRISQISGGEAIKIEKIDEIADRFQDKLRENHPPKVIRTTLWDRPWVLLVVLGIWMTSWIVRRRSGLV